QLPGVSAGGCGAEDGGCPERKKDRAEKSVIHSPGSGCTQQRERGEQTRARMVLGSIFPRSVGWKDGRVLAERGGPIGGPSSLRGPPLQSAHSRVRRARLRQRGTSTAAQ